MGREARTPLDRDHRAKHAVAPRMLALLWAGDESRHESSTCGAFLREAAIDKTYQAFERTAAGVTDVSAPELSPSPPEARCRTSNWPLREASCRRPGWTDAENGKAFGEGCQYATWRTAAVLTTRGNGKRRQGLLKQAALAQPARGQCRCVRPPSAAKRGQPEPELSRPPRSIRPLFLATGPVSAGWLAPRRGKPGGTAGRLERRAPFAPRSYLRSLTAAAE